MSAYHAEATRAAQTADLLATGHSLDHWSLAFALLAAGALFLGAGGHDAPVRLACIATLAVAVVQKYFAVRTQLDAAIFRRWAEQWQQPYGSTPEEDMAALDTALGKSGIPLRPLADRIRGARRLLVKQAACLVIQMLCFAVGACSL